MRNLKGHLKKITALQRYKRCRWSSLQRTFFYYHYHHVLFLQISFSLLYLRNILDSPECTAYSCEICFTFTQHVYMYGLHTNIVPQATIWSFYIWCTNVSKCIVLPLSQTVVCPNNSFLSPTLNGHVPLRWVWNSWHIAIKINMNKTQQMFWNTIFHVIFRLWTNYIYIYIYKLHLKTIFKEFIECGRIVMRP